jgi:hypothetical protein
MGSKGNSSGGYRPPAGSRNPYDYPGMRVPNYYDGRTPEEIAGEIDARVVKVFDELIAKNFAKDVREYIEKRLDGVLFYRGLYADGTEYGPGSLVQHGGTVWVAKDGAAGKPGTDGSGWRMLVKTKGSTSDGE